MQRYQPKSKFFFQTKKFKINNFNIYKLNKKKWNFIKKQNKSNILIQTEKKKELFKEYLYIRQNLKLFYGDLSKKQFNNILILFFQKTKILKQNTFLNLFCFLETRLDVLLTRLYIAKSIFHAKQLINHGNIWINKKKINSPYYFLKQGDIIYFPYILNLKLKKNIAYVEYNFQLKKIIFLRIPSLNEIKYPFINDFSISLESI